MTVNLSDNVMKRFFKDLKSHLSLLFSANPLTITNYNSKRIISLFLLIVFSHAIWLGLWIYYRLKDLWILNIEPLYSQMSIGAIHTLEFLISFSLGILLFCLCFLFAILINHFMLYSFKVPRRKVSRLRLTLFQFSFSPLFSLLMIGVTLITQTYYYDRGFIFYPFIMACLYFIWMAFLNYKVHCGVDLGEKNYQKIGKSTSIALFSIYTIGFFVLFLLIPLFLPPYHTLFTVIW
jgi:hypothetical protein